MKEFGGTLILTWLSYNTNTGRDLVTEGPGHGKPRNILMLQPYTERTHWILIRVSEGVDPSATFEDPLGLVWLARLLVSTYGLSSDFAGVRVLLNNYASGVAHIRTEELLSHSNQADACRPRKSDIKVTSKEGFIAI